MLTIFSIPKPFIGHVGVIQRNALYSWMQLGNGVQVILYGNEEGVAEAAREIGAEHFSEIDRNEFGTPLVSSAFSRTADLARNQLLCYANSDIMFMDELTSAAASIRKRQFLMAGRRWNIDITELWDFTQPEWRNKLIELTRKYGILDDDNAIDYFVFPRGSKLTSLPPFAVGRPGWDNYFLFRCRQLGYPLIDATEVIMAVHQNHDYSHVPKATGYRWDGPEAEANKKLVANQYQFFELIDATHKLTKSGLEKSTKRWRGSTYLALHPRQWMLVRIVVGAKAILRRIGLLPVIHQ